MLIKVKTNYGLAVNGLVKLKTPKMPPFHVSDEKGEELIARGIAVKIADDEPAAEETAPAETKAAEEATQATSPAPVEAEAPEENDLSEMTRPELLELAEKRGIEVSKRAKKEDILTALKGSAE